MAKSKETKPKEKKAAPKYDLGHGADPWVELTETLEFSNEQTWRAESEWLDNQDEPVITFTAPCGTTAKMKQSFAKVFCEAVLKHLCK